MESNSEIANTLLAPKAKVSFAFSNNAHPKPFLQTQIGAVHLGWGQRGSFQPPCLPRWQLVRGWEVS